LPVFVVLQSAQRLRFPAARQLRGEQRGDGKEANNSGKDASVAVDDLKMQRRRETHD
jgi:hypothetical protein